MIFYQISWQSIQYLLRDKKTKQKCQPHDGAGGKVGRSPRFVIRECLQLQSSLEQCGGLTNRPTLLSLEPHG